MFLQVMHRRPRGRRLPDGARPLSPFPAEITQCYAGRVVDTHPTIVEVQRELLRKAGIGRRAALLRSLSSTVIELSRRELRARRPMASETELAVEWVKRNYGADLAARLHRYLLARDDRAA